MEKAFADDPDDDLQTILSSTECSCVSRLLVEAEEKFGDAVKVSGGYHRAYANLALVKFAQGKEEQAIDYISKVCIGLSLLTRRPLRSRRVWPITTASAPSSERMLPSTTRVTLRALKCWSR